MPALRRCKRCRQTFAPQSDEAYCSADCQAAHEGRVMPVPRDHPELREPRITPPEFATMVEMARRYRAGGMTWED